MLEHELDAARLVDHDDVSVDVAALPSDEHDRYLGGGGADVWQAHPWADENDPVDAVLEQRGDGGALAARLATAGAEKELEAALRCELLDAAGDLGEERVMQVVEHDADGVRAPAREPAGHGVRAVAEPGRGLEDSRALGL